MDAMPEAGLADRRVADERIVGPLGAEGGGRSVAGQELDVVTQREQLLANGVDQGGVVAAGEVGAADGAVKQHVADHGEALLRMHIDHVTRSSASPWSA